MSSVEGRHSLAEVTQGPPVLGLAQEGVPVQRIARLVGRCRGQELDRARTTGAMRTPRVDREAGRGGLGTEQILGQSRVEQAGVLFMCAGIAPHHQAAEGAEDLEHP